MPRHEINFYRVPAVPALRDEFGDFGVVMQNVGEVSSCGAVHYTLRQLLMIPAPEFPASYERRIDHTLTAMRAVL